MTIATRLTAVRRLTSGAAWLHFACLALLLAGGAAQAATNSFYLAQQKDGSAGFLLHLESNVAGHTCPLWSVTLSLGIGDGATWRPIDATPA